MSLPTRSEGRLALVAALLLVGAHLLLAGCGREIVTHEARRPVVEFDNLAAGELEATLNQLRAEQEQLQQASRAMSRRKQQCLGRFAAAIGQGIDSLRQAQASELRIHIAQLAVGEGAAAVGARELAQHAAHLGSVEKRLILLQAAIEEGEAHRRVLDNYVSVGAAPPVDASLLGKLGAVAGQRVELPLDLSPEDVAHYVADELVAERQAIERRRQEAAAQRAVRDTAEQATTLAAAAELARREEAARLELFAAARQRAAVDARRQAETLADQHAAMALRRYADAYHAFFRAEYRDAALLLDEAIGLHGNDPRFFYLRGLARLRLGQSQPATDDFRGGGERERQRPYGVSQALERIQGHERMLIEQYRP